MASAGAAGVVRFGAFKFDVSSRELQKGRTRLKVPDQSLTVLAMLLEHPGELVSREAIQARLWPHGTIVEFEHSVNAAVKRLRVALSDTATTPRYVETLPRRGYRFVGTLEPVESQRAERAAGSTTIPDRKIPLSGLGHYRIIRKLGEGGMGTVYEAHDERLDRAVALKTLRTEVQGDEARRRLWREARSLARVSHPNICQIFDAEQDGDTVFLVLELLQGKTLAQGLNSGPIPVAEAVGIECQILRALDELHRHSIVHRDLKPSNVFLTPNGVKVLDFGVARLMEMGGESQQTPSHLTAPGAIVGTPHYMAPEQARGAECGPAADIFSVGCVLYEMLAGARPFEGDTPVDVLHNVIYREPPPLAGSPQIEAVSAVLRRAMAKNPEDRWPSAGAMRAALEGARDQAPIELPRGHPVPVLRAAELPRRHTIAVLPFLNLSLEPSSSFFSDGLTEELMYVLSKMRELSVVARTSAFQFRGGGADIREIGRALNTELILEGSVRLAANELHVMVRLVRTADGIQLWSGRFDREAADVFQIQHEIAVAVAESLSTELPVLPPTAPPTAYDLEAFNLYLKGRQLWNQRSEAGFRTALTYFERAIARDPRLGRAYAGMAESYVLMSMAGLAPARTLMPQARAAALAALGIDPDLAQARSALAAVHALFDWDLEAAASEFERAIRRDSEYETAWHWRAAYCDMPAGRFQDALADIQHAQSLDPLSIPILDDTGTLLYWQHRYEEAEAKHHSALELNQAFYRPHMWLARCDAVLGRYNDAIARCERALAKMEGDALRSLVLATLGYAHARLGNQAEAERAMAALKALDERSQACSFEMAILETGRERWAEAFAYLEEAVVRRSGWMVWLNVEPLLDALHTHPRFAQIQRMVFKAGR